MIKIVFTIGTLLTGGAEVFVCNLIKNLDKNKFEKSLIVLDKKNNTFLENIIEDAGINVYYMNKPDGLSLKTMIKIYRLLKIIKPNIIHGNIGGIIYVLLYLFFNRNVKAVHTAHTLAKYEFGKYKRIVLKYFYKRGKIIPVVISRNNLAEFKSTYKLNDFFVKVITNGVDINKFSIERTFNRMPIRIGHVGRFEEVKNHKMIFLIYEKLLEKGLYVTLRLVGKGSLLNVYKSRYIDDDKVEFIEETSKVEEELKQIDIFIFPSIYEGMPLALIEAMASGCVIVASDVGGINSLIEDGVNGYKYHYDDINSYVNIMKKLILNPNKMKEISNNNKKKSKFFSLEVMVKEYEDLYLKEVD